MCVHSCMHSIPKTYLFSNYSLFLGASTHLYNRSCLSIRQLVCPSRKRLMLNQAHLLAHLALFPFLVADMLLYKRLGRSVLWFVGNDQVEKLPFLGSGPKGVMTCFHTWGNFSSFFSYFLYVQGCIKLSRFCFPPPPPLPLIFLPATRRIEF